MSKLILKPIFGVILLLGVSFLYRINLDNRVLLVSCVDLLTTKITICLSELQVDYSFLLGEIDIFLFQLEFSSVEPKKAFTTSSDPSQQLPLSVKSSMIPAPDLRLKFLLKETAYQNDK